MSDKNSSKEEKKALKGLIEARMIELLLSLDPEMKEKKILRRARQAARILGRGVRVKTVPVEAGVFEIKPEDPEMTSQL